MKTNFEIQVDILLNESRIFMDEYVNFSGKLIMIEICLN